MRTYHVKIKLSFAILFSLIICQNFAQKGLPAKEPTNATVNTNFPQHEDFKESMISRITVENLLLENVRWAPDL